MSSRNRGESRLNRRTLLMGFGTGLVGLGSASLLGETGAFSNVRAPRVVNVTVAEDESNAIVGIQVYGPVKKNRVDPMVRITNNTSTDASVTVSLQTCSDGTLHDPQGDTGCTVTFPMLSGNSGTVDIEAEIEGTVPFDIDFSSPSVSYSGTRTVEAQGGNTSEAVRINNVQKFQANAGSGFLDSGDWTIKKVQVQDRDNDDDIDQVDYEITDSNGTVRATRSDTFAPTQEYQEQNITIDPDSPLYSVQSGEVYTLTVTAYDADGNFDTETVQDTA